MRSSCRNPSRRGKPVRQPLPEHLPREQRGASAGVRCPDCGGAHAPDRRGCQRSARVRAGALQGGAPCAAEAEPARAASASCRNARAVAADRARDWPDRGCWRTSWCRSTPITCRCTARRRSTPAGDRADRSTLADWVGDCSRLLCAAGRRTRSLRAWRRTSCTPTTARCRCWSRAAARPGPDGCGRMCAMTGRAAAPIRRRCCFAIRPIARASMPRGHLKSFAGVLQADAYAGFDELYVDGRSWKPAAGRMCGASSTTFTRTRARRSPPRRCAASANCTRSRTRSAAITRRACRGRGARADRCWTQLKTGSSATRQSIEEVRAGGGHPLRAVALDGDDSLSRRWPAGDRQQRCRTCAARGCPGPQELSVRRLRRRRRARRRACTA